MNAYEIHGLRDDDSVFGEIAHQNEIEPLYEGDADAYSVPEHYAALWEQAACVRLYRTPELNLSSVSSLDLWPGQVDLITEIPVKLKAPPPSLSEVSEDEIPF